MAVDTLPAGTSCMTQVEDRIIDVITDQSPVHAFLGVADKAGAMAGNLYLDSAEVAVNDEEQSEDAWKLQYPMIMIDTPGDEPGVLTFTSEASGGAYLANGKFSIRFAILRDPSLSEARQFREFKDAVIPIITSIVTDSRMAVLQAGVSQYGVSPVDEHDDLGEVFMMEVEIQWGTESGGDD